MYLFNIFSRYFARKDYDGTFSLKLQLSAINQKTSEHVVKKVFERNIPIQKL